MRWASSHPRLVPLSSHLLLCSFVGSLFLRLPRLRALLDVSRRGQAIVFAWRCWLGGSSGSVRGPNCALILRTWGSSSIVVGIGYWSGPGCLAAVAAAAEMLHIGPGWVSERLNGTARVIFAERSTSTFLSVVAWGRI
jgi:hypothetical protein